jgi:uncharacterized membrane protein
MLPLARRFRLKLSMSTAGVLVALALTPLGGGETYAQETPRIQTDIIGSFGSYQMTVPTAINDRGDIVGYVSPTGTMAGVNAFIWTRESGFELIATDALATDINSRGDVTGYSYECFAMPWGGYCIPHGFVWNVRTGFMNLGSFVPTAINNRGDMAGECSTGQALAACAIIKGVRHQWTCDLPECGQIASGINDRGDVVGWRASPDFTEAMLFPRRGAPVVLGAQTAEDINNAGTIAGRAPTSVWPSNATLWTRHGIIQAPGAETTVAVAVNARGWAAGIQFGSDGPNGAFFWDGRGSTVTPLAPEAFGSEATDINDRGQIVGVIQTGPFWEVVVWTVRQ